MVGSPDQGTGGAAPRARRTQGPVPVPRSRSPRLWWTSLGLDSAWQGGNGKSRQKSLAEITRIGWIDSKSAFLIRVRRQKPCKSARWKTTLLDGDRPAWMDEVVLCARAAQKIPRHLGNDGTEPPVRFGRQRPAPRVSSGQTQGRTDLERKCRGRPQHWPDSSLTRARTQTAARQFRANLCNLVFAND